MTKKVALMILPNNDPGSRHVEHVRASPLPLLVISHAIMFEGSRSRLYLCSGSVGEGTLFQVLVSSKLDSQGVCT